MLLPRITVEDVVSTAQKAEQEIQRREFYRKILEQFESSKDDHGLWKKNALELSYSGFYGTECLGRINQYELVITDKTGISVITKVLNRDTSLKPEIDEFTIARVDWLEAWIYILERLSFLAIL